MEREGESKERREGGRERKRERDRKGERKGGRERRREGLPNEI